MIDVILRKRILRYGIVGVMSNAAGYLLFLSLLYMSVEAVIASGVTFITVLLINYLVNRRWVFNSGQRHASDAPRYLVAYGIGLGTAMVSMRVLSEWMRPELAQLFVILLAATVIYLSLLLLRFGEGNPDAH